MGHELVLTHGNGPQVGFLAIEADAAAATVPPPPLDVLVAESMGQIGYLLAQALTAQLVAEGRERPVTVVLTRTVVDAADVAFAAPSKPVGPVYDEPTARDLAQRAAGRSPATAPAGGASCPRPNRSRSWRRQACAPSWTAAPSSSPLAGSIPVARSDDGTLAGVEAIVDKDLAAVLLAEAIGDRRCSSSPTCPPSAWAVGRPASPACPS